jgi:hypothetical protein
MRKLVEVDPMRLAMVFALGIGVLGMLGAVDARYEAAPAFDLDAELKLPAFAAALILLTAAAVTGLAAAIDPSGPWPWRVLAALFLLMAADEVVAVHETLEELAAVDWQLLYLPVMAVGGVAWLIALTRLHRLRLAAVLLVAGAAAWATAGLLEAVQWSGPRESEHAVAGYGILMGVEELLEMCGSAAFALAPSIASRAWAGTARTVPAVAVPAAQATARS